MSPAAQSGWRFAARDEDGKTFTGTLQATTEEEARRFLVAQKLTPLTIEPQKRQAVRGVLRGVDPRALTVFTRQFATLVDAALPLLSVIEMLTELTEDRALKAALLQVQREINGGSSLSEALEAHPDVFGPIYLHMVEAGEVGGTLPGSLMAVADYLERSQEIQERLRGALIYPAVVLAVAVVAVGVILTFVVPIFSDLFASEGLELPFTTRLLVSSSAVTSAYWHVMLMGVAGAALALRGAMRTRAGRRWSHMLYIRLPFLGDLVRKAAVARLTRAIASMTHSGVPLPDTLLAAARISGNWEVEAAILEARDAIMAGSDLNTPLAKSAVLPRLLPQMVKVGEESGRMEEMMEKVADFYDMEVRTALDGAMKALEPALIVVLGGVLGGIIVAMYTPIFDLMTSLG